MRVCIITIFDEMNYGAYLQAYTLGKKVEEYGHQVSFYKKRKWNVMNSIHALHLRNPECVFFHGKLLENFKKDWRRLNIVNSVGEEFDLVIIGSDELWNVRNYNFEHERYYIGEEINAQKRITYAVSSNNCTEKEFLEQYQNIDNFKYLNDVAVRDKNTYDIVQSISNREPVLVLDPTFLISINSNNSNSRIEEYILIYGYYFTEEEVKDIKRYVSNNFKAKLISVGFYHAWCDKNIACSPLQFIGYIKSARLVITSTFHGTALSINLRKNFITFSRDNLKILDILSRFGLESRNATTNNINEIEKTISYEKNFDERMSYWIKQSEDYLDKYLRN